MGGACFHRWIAQGELTLTTCWGSALDKLETRLWRYRTRLLLVRGGGGEEGVDIIGTATVMFCIGVNIQRRWKWQRLIETSCLNSLRGKDTTAVCSQYSWLLKSSSKANEKGGKWSSHKNKTDHLHQAVKIFVCFKACIGATERKWQRWRQKESSCNVPSATFLPCFGLWFRSWLCLCVFMGCRQRFGLMGRNFLCLWKLSSWRLL